jgi:hypothetical protein
LQATVRNATGASLPPFTVVYISGAVGNKASVSKAQANAESTSAGTYAITETTIANNANGNVIAAGVLSNVDTSAYADGDKLYLSPTVAGGVTTTKPSAPNHLVYVGVVTRSHSTLGTVSVRIQNGYELDELHDVAIASKTDNDLLAYESSTSLWKNKSFSTLGLLTSATASTTYAPLASPSLTGTPLSTTASVSTNTTQIATTAFVLGQAGTASPIVNGTAAVGTSLLYSRQDHVHPTDTTRAALNSPAFTGTPSLPTGATGITQTAGDNTTALATTAFVTAAVPAFATNVQSIASSSTTTALSPFNSRFSQLASFVYAPATTSLTSVTSGGGSSTMSSYGGSIGSSSSLAGYVLRYTSPYIRGVNVTGGIQWQKANMFAIRIVPYFAWQTASIFRMTLGSSTATLNVLANKGIGISFGASATNTLSALVLDVHNGTTLTSVTSSFTPVLTQGFDVMVYSDGAGNVTLYVNDVQVATTSAGPTTAAIANYNILQLGIENTTTLTTGSNLGFSSLKTFIS